MLRTIVQEQILFITVNRRKRTVREVHAWCSSPEIYSILFTAVEVFQGLFKTMIMDLMWTGVGL
jgi:hypothetical protein